VAALVGSDAVVLMDLEVLAKTAGVKGKEVPTEEVSSEVDLSAMQD